MTSVANAAKHISDGASLHGGDGVSFAFRGKGFYTWGATAEQALSHVTAKCCELTRKPSQFDLTSWATSYGSKRQSFKFSGSKPFKDCKSQNQHLELQPDTDQQPMQQQRQDLLATSSWPTSTHSVLVKVSA